MDVWHRLEESSGAEALVIAAGPDDQDALLVEKVGPLVEPGSHSFLRAIKPDWRLIVVSHAEPLTSEAADAVADSRAAIAIIRLDREGRVARSRREIAFASIVRALHVLALTADERLALHEEAYRWPIEIGRWDAVAVAGLESKFLALHEGLASLTESARAGAPDAWGGPEATRAALERWARVGPDPMGSDRIGAARRLLARHENRLGVFAEADAVLHYFLFRLAGGAPEPAGSPGP